MKLTLYLDDYIIIQYFPGYSNDKERRLFLIILSSTKSKIYQKLMGPNLHKQKAGF